MNLFNVVAEKPWRVYGWIFRWNRKRCIVHLSRWSGHKSDQWKCEQNDHEKCNHQTCRIYTVQKCHFVFIGISRSDWLFLCWRCRFWGLVPTVQSSVKVRMFVGWAMKFLVWSPTERKFFIEKMNKTIMNHGTAIRFDDRNKKFVFQRYFKLWVSLLITTAVLRIDIFVDAN